MTISLIRALSWLADAEFIFRRPSARPKSHVIRHAQRRWHHDLALSPNGDFGFCRNVTSAGRLWFHCPTLSIFRALGFHPLFRRQFAVGIAFEDAAKGVNLLVHVGAGQFFELGHAPFCHRLSERRVNSWLIRGSFRVFRLRLRPWRDKWCPGFGVRAAWQGDCVPPFVCLVVIRVNSGRFFAALLFNSCAASAKPMVKNLPAGSVFAKLTLCSRIPSAGCRVRRTCRA